MDECVGHTTLEKNIENKKVEKTNLIHDTVQVNENKRLYLAIEFDETSLALKLLSKQNLSIEYIDPSNTSKWTMLHWASYHGNEKIVSALLAYDAEIEQRSKSQHDDTSSSHVSAMDTPLHKAALKGHLATCWLLLFNSHCTNDRDSIGNTPLHIAASNGHLHVVSCFVEHGADVWIRNRYGHTALNITIDAECKQYLEDKMAEEEYERATTTDHSLNEKREKMRKKHEEEYHLCRTEILNFIEKPIDHNHIEEIQLAINNAQALGVVKEVINLGQRRKNWLEIQQELLYKIKTIEDNAPIVNQSLFAFVTELEELIQIARSMRMKAKKDDRAVIDLDPLLNSANIICEVAKREFDLQQKISYFDSVSCASQTEKVNIENLSDAIDIAKTINNEGKKCHTALIETACSLLNRLYSELKLHEAREKLSKKIRLPVPNMSTKDEKDYWTDDDIGHILQTKEYPFPPEDTGTYEWISSNTLVELKESIKMLKDALAIGESCNANDKLVQESKDDLKIKNEEYIKLKVKDKLDFEAAILETQKMVKKLRKKKKVKKNVVK